MMLIFFLHAPLLVLLDFFLIRTFFYALPFRELRALFPFNNFCYSLLWKWPFLIILNFLRILYKFAYYQKKRFPPFWGAKLFFDLPWGHVSCQNFFVSIGLGTFWRWLDTNKQTNKHPNKVHTIHILYRFIFLQNPMSTKKNISKISRPIINQESTVNSATFSSPTRFRF